jgi:hypothetical protein
MVKLLDLDFDELRGLDFQWVRIIFLAPDIAGNLCRRVTTLVMMDVPVD